MKIYELTTLDRQAVEDICARPAINFDSISGIAGDVIARVRNEGDKALRSFTKKFDGVDLNNFQVSYQEIKKAEVRLPESSKTALEQAAENIENFHKSQLMEKKTVETMPGVVCFSEMRPIEKVGLYVPGGTAPLPSTVLMLGIPARLAGCQEVVLCSPPSSGGRLPDATIYAAYICGINKIYKLGGAQAIAAMAYGSETMPKVYKIFGPGNQYVTAAKMLVSIDPKGAAIDMPAGPTELLVVADEAARVDFVAADLLSQAEHGADSQVVLVCFSKEKAGQVKTEIKRQIASLPRKDIAKKSLQNSFILIAEDLDKAIEFSNKFAPEHLILNVEEPNKLVNRVINAGSVFLGAYSCESAGDYASGTNHSLPTYGYARTYGGVSVASFQKQVTFQEVSKKGAGNIGPIVSEIAAMEGLEAHKRAMEIRMEAE